MKRFLFVATLAIGPILTYKLISNPAYTNGYFANTGEPAVVLEGVCSDNQTSICKVAVVSNTPNNAIVHVTYNYSPNSSTKTIMVLSADKGKFDNTVGVVTAYKLKEGSHTAQIYVELNDLAPSYTREMYNSKQLHLALKEVNENTSLYPEENLIDLRMNYERDWFNLSTGS